MDDEVSPATFLALVGRARKTKRLDGTFARTRQAFTVQTSASIFFFLPCKVSDLLSLFGVVEIRVKFVVVILTIYNERKREEKKNEV